jgi:hypothetical protein
VGFGPEIFASLFSKKPPLAGLKRRDRVGLDVRSFWLRRVFGRDDQSDEEAVHVSTGRKGGPLRK